MVTTFDTTGIAQAAAPTGTGSNSGIKILFGLLVVGLGAWLVYKHVIKPAQEKKKLEENNTNDAN